MNSLTVGGSTTTPAKVCSHTGMLDGSKQSDELMYVIRVELMSVVDIFSGEIVRNSQIRIDWLESPIAVSITCR